MEKIKKPFILILITAFLFSNYAYGIELEGKVCLRVPINNGTLKRFERTATNLSGQQDQNLFSNPPIGRKTEIYPNQDAPPLVYLVYKVFEGSNFKLSIREIAIRLLYSERIIAHYVQFLVDSNILIKQEITEEEITENTAPSGFITYKKGIYYTLNSIIAKNPILEEYIGNLLKKNSEDRSLEGKIIKELLANPEQQAAIIKDRNISYSKGDFVSLSNYQITTMLLMLEKFSQTKPKDFEGSILIIGLGKAENALRHMVFLAEHYPKAKILGVEYDEVEVHIIRRLLGPKNELPENARVGTAMLGYVEFLRGRVEGIYQGDARNLKDVINPNSVKMVIFPAVLDLYPENDQQKMLEEAYRILEDNGQIVAGLGLYEDTNLLARKEGFRTPDEAGGVLIGVKPSSTYPNIETVSVAVNTSL